MPRQEFSYGVVPVRRRLGGAEFLLVKHQSGHWTFPKGHAEKGEGALAAARRELREETGVSRCRLLPRVSFKNRYLFTKTGSRGSKFLVRKDVVYYLGFVSDKQVFVPRGSRDEIAEARWCALAEARGLIRFKTILRILERAATYLGNQ
jgi:8-oxo-dGTP pyrophosphatase MutT (NUDIX family)